MDITKKVFAAGDEAEPANLSKAEKRREQKRQWREKNKAHIKAWAHQYYLDNKAAINAATRRWAQAHPDKKRAYMAAWRQRNSDKIRAWRKEFRAAQKMYRWEWWQKVDAKCRSDADYYAKFRAAQRLSAAKRRAKKIGLDLSSYGWKPGPRIPDWARKGEVVVDAASVYLWNNRSAAELVAARAYNIENRTKRDRWGVVV